MRKVLKAAGVLILMTLVVQILTMAYFLESRKARDRALAAMHSSSQVEVTTDPWYIFTPKKMQPTTGLIIYPGAFVDAAAYAEPAHAIAAEGYLVVLVPVPMGMAILAPNRAAKVQEAFPDIDTWVVGGHSLGGAVATRYVFQNPDAADGLLLWVGKPLGDDDLSGRAIPVMSIYGTLDSRRPPEVLEEIKLRYPAQTEYVAINGGNHIFFGDYSPDDKEQATISHDEQTRIIVQASISFLKRVSTGAQRP